MRTVGVGTPQGGVHAVTDTKRQDLKIYIILQYLKQNETN
jgi:hypothetical protein